MALRIAKKQNKTKHILDVHAAPKTAVESYKRIAELSVNGSHTGGTGSGEVDSRPRHTARLSYKMKKKRHL